MNPYILAALAFTGWVALLGGIWALMRDSARRDRAQERAHQEWLLRGWDR